LRKNKLYILITILTSIFLFSTAAVYNQCTALFEELSVEEAEEEMAKEEAEEEDKEEEEVQEVSEEKPAKEGTEEEIEEVAEQEEEDEEQANEEVEEEKTPPTIELQIYEGPTYSDADEVCYYRVEAIVTGNPIPAISFSKDDSGSAWGSTKCQVNLHDPTETYTLTATATNSEGTVADSLILSWGCKEEPPGGESGGDGDGEDGLDFELPEWGGREIMGSQIYYDFIENAPSAIWKSDLWHVYPAPGLLLRTFGDTYTRYGAVFYRYHGILEDVSGYPRVLETHPYEYNQGFICGIYQNITIPENATFRTKIGFLRGHAPEYSIRFQVFFDETGDSFGDYCDWHQIMSFHKDYSGVLYNYTADLDILAGKTGNFVFLVRWGRSGEECCAIWVDPAIYN